MRGWEIELEAARPIVAEGLRLCLAGDESAGLARYRSVAFPQHFAHLPLGLHIDMLREGGRDEAADALTAITLGGGGDLAWKAARAGVSDADRAAEYARFFAAGLGNPHMVDRYLRALTRLGRTDDVAAIFDPARLLHTVKVDVGDAAQALLDREAEGRESERQSVYKMRMLRGLNRIPEFDALLAACRAETAAYTARWAASGHPLARLVPNDFEIRAWGLISRGEGYNSRHQHPVGWATGVYYPIGLPEAIGGGSLCVGGWRDPAPAGWPTAKIRPEAGLLVLMPSYYVHWTEPLGAPGLRLSVAFDAVPA
jgi:hypothetical protein